jgi:conjugal transfer mating pair stabilization protein TraG
LRFDPANPAGAAVTCQDAWSDPAQGLRAWFANPANYAAEIDRAAATAGFDPASAAERLRYRALVTNTVREHLALAGITPERLSQQGTIARQLFEFVKDGNPAVAAALRSDQTATAGLFGRGVAANQWIPAIRAVFTALAAGTLPFLALFLPSPFFKRALQFFLGLFVFLTAWGVIDAVAHSFALEYARDYFETVRQSRLSLATWLNFPDAATRSFALLGSIRTIGALLAAAVGTVVGVQAPALTALASHLTGPVTEHGRAAGRAVRPRRDPRHAGRGRGREPHLG